MLSRDVCRNCYETHGIDWGESEQKRWEEGWVLCNAWLPLKLPPDWNVMNKDFNRVTSQPSLDCIYQLEHFLETQVC